MSRLRVEYTLGARRELKDSYLWIKERSPQGAEKWRNELLEAIEALADHPLRWPVAPENDRFPREIREIRLLLFRKRQSQFRVYFTVESQRVVILSVRRSSRRPLEEDDLPE